ncbi:uncharacterized protein AB675_7208 [Cyphellophora attinorum]|uniref:Uncharacterized protein n=1 Tax=Cyphellophora attinorum TaxID=1664694 RepID=A0A0N1H314_9EURO|nr:uncharacterized protein AB675_7208 [Phialophora attinorum]KPI35076.1 hypothetical protein AB675_7208 [Phialophora attinorum]
MPWPLDGPLAFLGWTYIGVAAFCHAEGALLRSSYFAGTSYRKDYLNFHKWACNRLELQAPKFVTGVPHSTVLELFLQDYRVSLMSHRKPTWTQLFLPSIIHLNPVHLYASVRSVWVMFDTAQGDGPSAQLLPLSVMLAASTIGHRLDWLVRQFLFFSLPVSQQNEVSLERLRNETANYRRASWRGFMRNTCQLRLGPAWKNLKDFLRHSTELSTLSMIDPSIGASSGFAALRTMFALIAPRAVFGNIADTVGRSIASNLAEEDFFPYLAAFTGTTMLSRFFNEIAWMYPWMRTYLFPNQLTTLILTSAAECLQIVFGLAPRISHLSHLTGSIAGAGLLIGICGYLRLLRAVRANLAAR